MALFSVRETDGLKIYFRPFAKSFNTLPTLNACIRPILSFSVSVRSETQLTPSARYRRTHVMGYERSTTLPFALLRTSLTDFLSKMSFSKGSKGSRKKKKGNLRAGSKSFKDLHRRKGGTEEGEGDGCCSQSQTKRDATKMGILRWPQVERERDTKRTGMDR